MVAVKPLLVVNPHAAGRKSGRAYAAAAEAVDALLGPVDAAFTVRRGHGVELARTGAEEGRDLIIAVGGDGTLSEVVNGVMLSSRAGAVRVGLVAQGTGGDFRRSLGLEHGLSHYLEAIGSGRERPVDVGRLTYRDDDGTTKERFFINIVSAGLGGLVDRYVASAPAWVPGSIAYYHAALRAIVHCPEARVRSRSVLDGIEEERVLPAYVVAVCNGAFFGSGMHMAPMARVDDGVFEVVSVTQPKRLKMFQKSRTIYTGAHLREPGVVHFSCQSVTLDVEDEHHRSRFPLDVDGEPIGGVPVTVQVLPGALTLRA
jgi:diacylglycerol kinase (ATP)